MMASCKECFHKFVCTILENKGYQQDCKHFADRSRFVELPCRPDDSLFVIVPDKNGNPSIEEYTVYAVIKKRDRTILETRIGRFTWGKEPCWLSYTEAEQALKERENSD